MVYNNSINESDNNNINISINFNSSLILNRFYTDI